MELIFFTEQLLNGLLVGGYGLGQGAIFGVQTWLFARGEFHLLSAFGTQFSFLMLGILLVDAGSATTLARQAAKLQSESTGGEVWQTFWETAVVRAAIAVLVGTLTKFNIYNPVRWQQEEARSAGEHFGDLMRQLDI